MLSLNAVVPFPTFENRGLKYHFLEPRATLKFSFSPSMSLKGAYTMMNQFVHLVPNSTASLPTDVWITSSPFVKPEASRQVAFGLFKNLGITALNQAWNFITKT